MTQEERLLREVFAHPDLDEPRLVFADWLDERDDPRGLFIRTQCEKETLAWDDPRYAELVDLEAALLKQHRKSWLADLPKLKGVTWGALGTISTGSMWGNDRAYFRRGFVEYATIKDKPALEKNLRALENDTLISHLIVLNTNQKLLDIVATLPWLRGIEIAQGPQPFDWTWLRESPARDLLVMLSARECHVENKGLSDLTTIDLPSLRRLDIAFNSLSFPHEEFFAWDSLKGVQYLDVGLNDLAGRRRDLTDWHYDVKVLESLLQQPAWDNLHMLDVSCDSLMEAHMEVLAGSSVLRRLTHLSLSHNDLANGGVETLAAAELPELRMLDLAKNQFDADGIDALARSQWAPSLQQLNVGHNAIGDEGIVTLATSESFSSLTHLELYRTRFGEIGAAALAASTTFNHIQKLNVGDAEMSSATMRALKKRFPKAVTTKPYGY